MLRQFFWVVFVFLCLSMLGQAQSNFEAVEKQLTQNANVSGDFEQERQIQGLDNPLKSSGTFEISTDNGLVWLQQQPFKSKLTLTKDRLEQSVMDNPPTILTREQQPVVFTFTQVFMSVLQGDTKTIDEYFNIDFSGDVNNWQIKLTPKSSPMNKAIKNISLTGSKTIETVKISDTQDNVINIKFSNITVS